MELFLPSDPQTSKEIFDYALKAISPQVRMCCTVQLYVIYSSACVLTLVLSAFKYSENSFLQFITTQSLKCQRNTLIHCFILDLSYGQKKS